MIPSHLPDLPRSVTNHSTSHTTNTTKYMLPSAPTNVEITYSLIPLVNCYPMITMSKKGIHKPITPFLVLLLTMQNHRFLLLFQKL